ncbi:MAG: dUTPase, partial [Malacoplasma sp.]|nr:dUTPase [Malacoplasma sp.]
MEIKINEFFLLQEKLDNVVHKNHNIKNPMDVFIQRKLALAVEIAELANEVKCFKYWSVKKEDNKEKIGDEYADVLHFILS